MKKIGIVGVCVGGTELFYPYFIRQAILKFDKRNPELYINQLPLDKVDIAFSDMTKNELITMQDLILDSINQMHRLGIDMVVIPNNAAHTVITELQEKSPVPVISMLEAVAVYCSDKKIKKPLILGSRWVLEKLLFQKPLEKFDIHPTEISEENKIMIHDAVMDAMVTGKIGEAAHQSIIRLIEKMKQNQKCDAVIMACSDIVNTLQDCDLGIPMLNTMHILANSLLNDLK